MLRRKHGDSATLDLVFNPCALENGTIRKHIHQPYQKLSQNLSHHLVVEDPYPTPRHRKIFQLQLESLEAIDWKWKVFYRASHFIHCMQQASNHTGLHHIVYVYIYIIVYHVYMVEE